MKFNVFCDETLPDLFTTLKDSDKKLLIGSLWIEAELREEIKQDYKQMRRERSLQNRSRRIFQFHMT